MEKRFHLNEEMLAKAMKAKNPEELMALAKEYSIELTEEEAAEYFAELHKSGELSNEELANVAGGGACTPKCPACHTKDVKKIGEVTMVHDVSISKWRCNKCGKIF